MANRTGTSVKIVEYAEEGSVGSSTSIVVEYLPETASSVSSSAMVIEFKEVIFITGSTTALIVEWIPSTDLDEGLQGHAIRANEGLVGSFTKQRR